MGCALYRQCSHMLSYVSQFSIFQPIPTVTCMALSMHPCLHFASHARRADCTACLRVREPCSPLPRATAQHLDSRCTCVSTAFQRHCPLILACCPSPCDTRPLLQHFAHTATPALQYPRYLAHGLLHHRRVRLHRAHHLLKLRSQVCMQRSSRSKLRVQTTTCNRPACWQCARHLTHLLWRQLFLQAAGSSKQVGVSECEGCSEWVNGYSCMCTDELGMRASGCHGRP